ncbi:MAG TPA: hypothetical protein ENH85_14065 [Candidatus Scalindua sp.]|nr:hypothetical protein [Candidatus Scalindua sp.]
MARNFGDTISNLFTAMAVSESRKKQKEQSFQDAIKLKRAELELKQEFAITDPLKEAQAKFFQQLLGEEKTDIGTPIDLTRPKLPVDGGFATEKTITIEQDGRFLNIPTIINGKQVSQQEAIEHANRTGENVGAFNTQQEAVNAARRRSQEIGKLRGQPEIVPVDKGSTFGGLPPGTTFSAGGFNIPIVPKKSAAQEKREVEAAELSQGLEGLLTSFNRATAEAEKGGTPLVGERGPLGRIGGFLLGKKASIGASPAVKVFVDQRKAFATTVAKAAGEVRPTDVDIERFVATLPDPTTKTAEENALLVQDIKAKVQQGAKRWWEEASSKSEKTTSLTTSVTPSGVSFTFKRKE